MEIHTFLFPFSQAASSALGGPTLTHAVTRATKMLTATAMPTVATSVQSPSRYIEYSYTCEDVFAEVIFCLLLTNR